MNKAGKILSISPPNAIPGGEVLIECEGLELDDLNSFSCYFNRKKARIVGASSNRVLAIVPENNGMQIVDVHFENFGEVSNSEKILVGKRLAGDLHLVSNPAVDPKDGSIVVTRSGARGQELPVTLLRLGTDGQLSDFGANVMNPTGIAFDDHGKLFVTNRADGEVCQINRDEEIVPIATELGVATGIAFDREGVMFIGDRSGNIFRLSALGSADTWAVLEPSVSAYHMAFGRDGRLYVTAPGLCSFDSVYRIDEDGLDEIFFKGLGRPQGLAFDGEGNLYVAACKDGRHGIVRISPDGSRSELILSGMSIVGLCFTRQGDMIVATGDSIFTLPLEITGNLLH
ncbi:MAG: gluconolaconase [Acidobacteria bacterium]|nr:gluconolaconase [Acidobacteriota bacterium]